ncbi:MAG: LLM class flavin-dependent oxidoreductase [Ilumatobacter sp.]|uniref:LLM class flavin-dependent oxidoreductase n=1 Tax=Ilumatobacter sp. TaxID=1967498 RepID=UPI0026272B1E|nr:LLM class flavin-dependent oxidoreductase [Ilumatobacter sp.]MDJ0770061.1 LLM class flavin-dependent oxidoreductase [Ilumatobacter sp.]
MARARVGLCFDRTFPAVELPAYARQLEAAGVEQLWLIEDCFYTAGVSLAAAALAVTDRLDVGIGIMPAVARNPAIAAMEIATLANLAPGRFVAGIGHGVQEWMGQMGARTPSPLTTLDETVTVVKRLVAGEEVSFSGREVTLDAVQLDQPPAIVPKVVAGVQQQKSLALAGRVADGVILVEGAGPTYVDWALEQAGRPDDFHVVTFTMMAVADDRREAYGFVAPFVAGLIAERRPAFTVLPFFDEMHARVERGGADALIDMPADHWIEIGAIGTMDDALAHVAALEAAGVHSINVFPGDDLDDALAQVPTVAAIAGR